MVITDNKSSPTPPKAKPSTTNRRRSSKKASKSRSKSTKNATTHRHSALLSSLVEVSCHNGDKEWLKWHQQLGHRAFAVIKYIMSTGILAKSQRMQNLHNQVAWQTECPKCAACCYAKAKGRRVEWTKTTHSSVQDQPKSLKANILYPGQEVSVDHLVSSVPGRLYSGYGKGSKENIIKQH